MILRPLFPTTRLSYTNNSDKSAKYRSEERKGLYVTGTQMIKYFYIWGKHVMGFGHLYLFFLGEIGDTKQRVWGWPLFLLNTGTCR